MYDVYDGKIWNNFNDANKSDFFTKSKKYELAINLDWFFVVRAHKEFFISSVSLSSIKFTKA